MIASKFRGRMTASKFRGWKTRGYAGEFLPLGCDINNENNLPLVGAEVNIFAACILHIVQAKRIRQATKSMVTEATLRSVNGFCTTSRNGLTYLVIQQANQTDRSKIQTRYASPIESPEPNTARPRK
jgi:hypothetical protein